MAATLGFGWPGHQDSLNVGVSVSAAAPGFLVFMGWFVISLSGPFSCYLMIRLLINGVAVRVQRNTT